MTMSGPMREGGWSVTDDLIDAVTKDLQTSTGYSASGLSSRMDMALDTLDAKHLDSLAYLLSMVTLQVKRMAGERQAQEDAEQQQQYLNLARHQTSLHDTRQKSGPFPGARWTGALD